LSRGGPSGAGRLRWRLADFLVFLDVAVAEVDDPAGVHGDVVLVGHQHNRVAGLVQAVE